MSIIVSIVVGAVLTAASALLAPKPKGPDEQKERQNIRQSDLTGPSRYNATYGFESLGDIATWSSPVPIIFGKLVEESGLNTGGIIVTPDLVWSRLYSYGNQQIAKLLFAGGEWGAATPNKNGIYVGNQPLSKLSEFNYAVYYRSGQGNNRILGSDLKLGTRGTSSSGDPESDNDVFSCPTADAENDKGFCMAYTPSGDTAFGIYEPLANGTGRRVNWRIVSFLNVKSDEKDPGNRIRGERKKICGESDRGKGMPGVGREYGRQLGIVAFAPPGGGFQEVGERTQVAIDKGWKVKYLISGTEFEDDFGSDDDNVNAKDIQNASVNERIAADQCLQLGETIQIGRATWVVRERSREIWTEDSGDLEVILECTERFGAPWITVCWRNMVTTETMVKTPEPGKNLNAKNHVGVAASVLAKQAMAVIRPTRPADLIEIGIRSQVWQQFNGLCNFQELPDPDVLADYDEEGVTTLTNGNMNLYSVRSSFFTIKVRPAGEQLDGTEYDWAALNNQFVVTGRRPVDVFNYLRIQYPQQGQRYEFRLEPLPGGVAIFEFEDTEICEQLDAANGKQVTVSAPSAYGTFTVKYTGRRVPFIQLQKNPELNAKVRGFGVGDGSGVTEVIVDSYETRDYPTDHGKAHGWRTEVLGIPSQYPGQTRSRTIYKDIGTRRIGIKVTATSLSGRMLQSKPGYTPALYSSWRWSAPTFEIEESSGPWQVGDTFEKGYSITRDANGNNKWLHEAYTNGARTVIANFRVARIGESSVGGGQIEETTRQFIGASQCADVSYYGDLIRYSHNSGPEHNVVYVNEMISNETDPTYFNMNMFGLSVRSTGRVVDVSQLRYWLPGGVKVERTYPDADIFDDNASYGRSNLFSDLVWYLLTNDDTGAGDVISAEMLDRESFELTGKFLTRNRIFCDTVIQDPINVREYASGMAPQMLCNFVMKGGRFAVVPAVPVSDAGEISLAPVPIKAIFTEGNIVEDSFKLEYLPNEDRAPFKASATYRTGQKFQLPEEANVFVRYAGEGSGGLEGTVPLEQFAMAEWCTYKDQAVLACKYLLALRKHVTHTVEFKTSPQGLGLAPGDYIKVVTQSNPFATTRIGTVTEDGVITSIDPIPDGDYEVNYYRPGADAMERGLLTVKSNRSETLMNVVFSWGQPTNDSGVYMVEALTIGEDMMVDVVATAFPVDEAGVSIINKDITSGDGSSIWVVSE